MSLEKTLTKASKKTAKLVGRGSAEIIKFTGLTVLAIGVVTVRLLFAKGGEPIKPKISPGTYGDKQWHPTPPDHQPKLTKPGILRQLARLVASYDDPSKSYSFNLENITSPSHDLIISERAAAASRQSSNDDYLA